MIALSLVAAATTLGAAGSGVSVNTVNDESFERYLMNDSCWK